MRKWGASKQKAGFVDYLSTRLLKKRLLYRTVSEVKLNIKN